MPYLKDGNKHGFGHIIHQFSFENAGHKEKTHLTEKMKKRLGITSSPLDTSGAFVRVYPARRGAPFLNRISQNSNNNYMYQYFLKVVGTQYHFINGEHAAAHQFSVTQYERDLDNHQGAGGDNLPQTTHGISGIPGVFFNFEISPMMVVHHERRQAFAHFLTSYVHSRNCEFERV